MAQVRAPLSWLDAQLADGRNFLLGPDPAAIDAQFYHVVWFLRGRWSGGLSFLSEFTSLVRWEDNVRAIGHGTSRPMDPQNAIEQAKSQDPSAATGQLSREAARAGLSITVQPEPIAASHIVSRALVQLCAEENSEVAYHILTRPDVVAPTRDVFVKWLLSEAA